MKDYLVSGTASKDSFRFVAVRADTVVRTAQQRHQLSATATQALGRALIGTLLLSSAELKQDQKLTLRIQGDGPLGNLLVDGNANGEVRGYVDQPDFELPHQPGQALNVATAVGQQGILSVSKDLALKQPFVGQVPLVTGEIGDDLTYYLAKSEQIPASVGVAVHLGLNGEVVSAGGFLIEALPGASDKTLTQLETQLKEMPPLAKLLASDVTPEQMIQEIFEPELVKILQQQAVAFKCTCSKAHFADILGSLAKSQLEEMLQVDHGAEVVCKFCGQRYQFSEADLQTILAQ